MCRQALRNVDIPRGSNITASVNSNSEFSDFGPLENRGEMTALRGCSIISKPGGEDCF